MNLLAHALLAHAFLPDTDGQETCGAIMADFFTGQKTQDYPPAVARGILHHRGVDAFTDAHPAFLRTRDAISAEAPPHAGGILVDLFWDKVLGSHWESFGEPLCGMGLEDFSRSVYSRLEKSAPHRSPLFARVAPWIISMDWLGAYATREGIDRSLRGIASRLPHGQALADRACILDSHEAVLENGFRAFWPELLEYAENSGGRA